MTVLIEVNNTFDERRIYLLPEPPTSNTAAQRPKFHHTWPKDFHVSPFNSRDGFYSCSVRDLFLFPGGCSADSINITVTLLSSQHRPKLVSRLWSVSEPMDPFTIPICRALTFLASWSWQGPLICAWFYPFFLRVKRLTYLHRSTNRFPGTHSIEKIQPEDL
jgi:Protein of unknown function (DUF1365)